jgi:SagB-type dehydrogenase family enzyme
VHREQAGSMSDWMLLPPPRRDGQPLLQILGNRHSAREFAERDIPEQMLSDLLWAACGINRPQSGGRTAPSARNWQEIDVYVAKADGLFRYDPAQHLLASVLSKDLRAATGLQEFVATAPLNLVYVADLSKVDSTDPVERRFYCGADAGFIAENVYLYCASAGLACVVRGLLDRRRLAEAMQLHRRQRVLLAHTIGYPRG